MPLPVRLLRPRSTSQGEPFRGDYPGGHLSPPETSLAAIPASSAYRCVSALYLACGLAACGAGTPDAAERTAEELRGRLAAHALPNERACAAAGERSRWASAGAGYRQTAVFGDGEGEMLVSLAGVAVRGDSVFAYDAMAARVHVLSGDLRRVGGFGREGGGPGELARAMNRSRTLSSGSWRWIDAADTALVVFDGTQTHRFTPGGAFQSRSRAPGGAWAPIVGGYPRIRAAGADVYLASALVTIDSGRPHRWSVGRLRGDGLEPVLELTLPALPRWPDGATFRGAAQARPLWDLAVGCVVASDGASPWIVRRPLARGPADSLPVPLPDREPPKVDERAQLRDLNSGPGAERKSLPGPTAVRRVLDVIADPDGHLWLLPIQPKDLRRGKGIEVIRVAVGSGQVETDTVPAFPIAFGPPGVYYAAVKDEDDVVTLVRYQRQ